MSAACLSSDCDDATPQTSSDAVPLTIALINLIRAMQAAQTLYIAESIMAEQLGLTKPADDYWERLKTLFFDTYAAQVDATGLPRTLDGFGAVMRARITPAMRRIPVPKLPTSLALTVGGVRCGEIVHTADF